jgi:cysteinyl-tRNA synthetase
MVLKNMIYFKNTLSQKIEEFKPIKKGFVSLYHCGPTVYKRSHLGNLRPYIFADLMRRVFEYQKYKITQVINITDVGHLVSDNDEGEDKVENEAKKRGLKAQQITKEITQIFFQDLEKLNIQIKKIKFPRATAYIKEQIKFIQKLEKKGFSYVIDDGVYFDTSKFSDYGKLGKIDIHNLQEGARVNFNTQKRNITDFALWKFSKKDENREQEWNSPWGIGFPGWHIECSAMSEKILGQPFDIHTGGVDHIPTHHNNEIAQSESANEKNLANYWLHVNHLMINGQKISKSLGNVFYLDDIINKNIRSEVFKYWILTAHYSSQLNFSFDTMEATSTAFSKIINIFLYIKVGKISKIYIDKILNELNNDFNSPKSISLIWDMLKDPLLKIEDKKATLFEIDKLFGFNFEKIINEKEKELKNIKIPKEIIKLAEQRKIAKDEKDWAKSDQIRSQILELGYEIVDMSNNYQIRPKKD